jgi:hypothetical protein
MKTFIASLVLATLLAFPASAQSYDPDIGTGNLTPNYSTTNGATTNGATTNGAARDFNSFARVGAGRSGAATSAYAAVTPFGSPTASSAAARDSALRECATLSRRYTQTTWGTMEVHQFRSCMAQHGHVE